MSKGKFKLLCIHAAVVVLLYSTGKVIALDTSIVVNQFRAATPSLR